MVVSEIYGMGWDEREKKRKGGELLDCLQSCGLDRMPAVEGMNIAATFLEPERGKE